MQVWQVQNIIIRVGRKKNGDTFCIKRNICDIFLIKKEALALTHRHIIKTCDVVMRT